MLCFEHRRLRIGMDPVLRKTSGLTRLVELELSLSAQSIIPWMIDTAVFLGEIIFIMALRTNIGAHLIMRSLADIHTATGHCFNEALLVNPQFHSLRIMTG